MTTIDWARTTKHSIRTDRISKRVVDVSAGPLFSYTSPSARSNVFDPKCLLDESAATGKEYPELKRSDLLMVKKWVESLGQQLMSRNKAHPMIQYFEGVVHDYDSDDVAQGLREFLERYEQTKSSLPDLID